MGLQWAEHTIEISATPDEVFDAITDYETFPEWQSAVLGTEVTETDRKTKLGEVVKYDVDGKIRTIHYTLRYHYDRPGKIWWDFVEGQGINTFEGGYEIVESGNGTSATYKVGIDVTGVPGPLLKRAHKGTIKKANEDLKAEAERRAGASPDEPAADGGPEAPADYGEEEPDSITDAAMEVVESVGKLATVAGSRAIGAASKVLDGVGKRLMG